MNTRAGRHTHRQPAGFVLITALLLLVGLALLGASAMRTAIFDERASGNTAFRNRAHNLAEAALREAHSQAQTLAYNGVNIKNPAPPALIALNSSGAGDAFWKEASSWTSSNSVSVSVPNVPTASSPRYAIEILNIPNRPDRNTRGSDAKINIVWFRLTARATDPTTGAAVVLQETVRLFQ